MIKFYIQDTTIGKYVIFDTVPDLVKYFDVVIPRKFGISRKEFTQNLIDLGHGYDDPQGIMLTRNMSETFNIGIIRNNSYIRTNVHDAILFKKEEYGD